ncbi:hypothetical protein K1X76_11730 [bacterium]|nr:hypothetical protein [bacterium]
MIKPFSTSSLTKAFRTSKYLKLLSNFLVFPLVFSSFIGCGSDNQYTKQLLADPFVTKLYSDVSKTININVPDTSHVSWVALEQKIGEKFFKIEEIKIGDAPVTSAKSSPTLLLFDGDVAAIDSGESHTITVKIKYNPIKAITEDNSGNFIPHRAALVIVADDGGKQGTISVALEGYTQGVCTDCFEPITGSYEYTLDEDTDGDGDPDFQFYLCDSTAIPSNLQAPGKLPDGTDPSVPYNISTINLTQEATGQDVPHITVYTSKDSDKIIIDSGNFDNDPSIPKFSMPVPGGKPVAAVDVEMEKGRQAVCPMDASGIITCSDVTDSGVILSILGGVVPVSPLTLTNGKLENVGNTECPGFGTWTGSGKLTDDTMTVVAMGEVLDSDNSVIKETGITGALVVAVMKLKKIK